MCSFGRTCWCWWDRMHFFEELNMHTVWAGNIKGSKVVATGLFEILQQKETDFWPAGTRVCWKVIKCFQSKKNWQLLVPALAFLAQNYLRDALAYTPTYSYHFLDLIEVFVYFHIGKSTIWLWINTYRYIFNGMNIHLPVILMFTRGTGFWPIPIWGIPLQLPDFLMAAGTFGGWAAGGMLAALAVLESRGIGSSHVDQETCWEKTAENGRSTWEHVGIQL